MKVACARGAAEVRHLLLRGRHHREPILQAKAGVYISGGKYNYLCAIFLGTKLRHELVILHSPSPLIFDILFICVFLLERASLIYSVVMQFVT